MNFLSRRTIVFGGASSALVSVMPIGRARAIWPWLIRFAIRGVVRQATRGAARRAATRRASNSVISRSPMASRGTYGVTSSKAVAAQRVGIVGAALYAPTTEARAEADRLKKRQPDIYDAIIDSVGLDVLLSLIVEGVPIWLQQGYNNKGAFEIENEGPERLYGRFKVAVRDAETGVEEKVVARPIISAPPARRATFTSLVRDLPYRGRKCLTVYNHDVEFGPSPEIAVI